MGLSKSSEFTKQQNELAAMAKALGHPARIAILEVLLKRQSCVCGEIVDELPLSQSTISQHLKALKQVGIIKGEISGPRTCYCVDEDKWRLVRMALENFLGREVAKRDCC